MELRLVDQALDQPSTRRLHLGSSAPRAVDAFEHLAERRHAMARRVREVGPAVERASVRRQEDRHRPAAVAGIAWTAYKNKKEFY